eukprot:TRINITY_DN6210_c0_g1_i2.p1 TRINITY_DN6210_c0_g1~~TRINITY_DN6210_c0_g1_i2.p1  ORF type:complete len:562 (+),score=105.28 TRINITY_DN6210_c0_g1_i2:58-1743(+)
MATTAFLPVYKEGEWKGIPDVVHETLKHVLYYLHANKSKMAETEIRLEVAINQSQQAEEKLKQGAEEIKTMQIQVQSQISELKQLSNETEILIAQQKSDFNRLKQQLDKLDKVEAQTLTNSLILKDIGNRTETTEEVLEQHTKAISVISGRVKGVDESVNHFAERDRDRRMEFEAYRDGVSSDLRALRTTLENNMSDVRSRFANATKEIDLLKLEKDHLIEALQNPTAGLSKAISDRIEAQSKIHSQELHEIISKDILEVQQDSVRRYQNLEKDLDGTKTVQSEIRDLIEQQRKTLQSYIDRASSDLKELLSQEEMYRQKNEMQTGSKLKQLEASFGPVEVQFTEVRKRFGLIENRMQQADSFIGDSIKQIEDIIAKDFQRLENNLLQRILELPTNKLFEARLYSIETRLKLEESDRMFNEITLSQELEDISHTVNRRSRMSTMSVSIFLLHNLCILYFYFLFILLIRSTSLVASGEYVRIFFSFLFTFSKFMLVIFLSAFISCAMNPLPIFITFFYQSRLSEGDIMSFVNERSLKGTPDSLRFSSMDGLYTLKSIIIPTH